MSDTEWSPDEPLGTEVFEQGDEAMNDDDALDPNAADIVPRDASSDPRLLVDYRELAELGAEFDDPEEIAKLDGGIDDPDGRDLRPDEVTSNPLDDDEGWDLDAAETKAE